MEWADAGPAHAGPRQCRDAGRRAAARSFGAEGIGLCRTEHMFFEDDRIVAVREMILADDEDRPPTALAKLLPMQRGDFVELFEIMEGLPVTIRLLDPPLHEFLPQDRRGDRRSRQGDGRRAGQAARARARPARVQPDARPSRLPSRHLLSRDRRDAGPRHLRGGGRGRGRSPAKPSRRRSWCRWSRWRPSSSRSRAMIDKAADAGRRGARQAPGLYGRHHDRAAARGASGRCDRRSRRSSSPSAPTT